MMTLLYLVLLVGTFAALGRYTVPSAERLPCHTWTLRDLAANTIRGIRVSAELSEGQRRLWDHFDERHARNRRP